MTTSKTPIYAISQPSIDDAAELAAMHNQSWLDTYPNEQAGVSHEYIENMIAKRVSPAGIKKRQSFIQESYDNPDYFLRVAKSNNGVIVGFIDGRRKYDHYELNGLYTKKSTYGTGLGRELWLTYLSWASQNKDKDIILTVATYNDRAKSFYTKIGLQVVNDSERFFHETIIPVIDMTFTQTS
jgi:ribosomal protein S18 acetylase RimI-like enzyme